MIEDRFKGCLLGVALGNALGAPYEGGPTERLLWRLIGTTRDGRMRWTDDTQMALDLAESLAACGGVSPDDLARRFAQSYHWSRGYGPGAAKTLKRIARGDDWRTANRSVYPEGSFGNGGAMRSPMVGLYYANRQREVANAARLAASVTHVHPLGIEGAVLLACATAAAVSGRLPLDILRESASHCCLEPFKTRLGLAESWIEFRIPPPANEVARRLGNGITAANSCITSLYIALRFLDRPFLEMMAFVAVVGGDVDTIGAMAGAIWGAANGAEALPQEHLDRLEARERLADAAAVLYASTS